MKSQFSKSWRSSIQPRKQHKFNANAPLHLMHKFLSANLSKALRKVYGKRSLPLRKGDEVLVMRGKFKKKTAKVSSVNLKSQAIYLEGLQKAKRDGTKVNVPFHPSVLQIHTLNTDDKKRITKQEQIKTKIETKQTKGEKKNASN